MEGLKTGGCSSEGFDRIVQAGCTTVVMRCNVSRVVVHSGHRSPYAWSYWAQWEVVKIEGTVYSGRRGHGQEKELLHVEVAKAVEYAGRKVRIGVADTARDSTVALRIVWSSFDSNLCFQGNACPSQRLNAAKVAAGDLPRAHRDTMRLL